MNKESNHGQNERGQLDFADMSEEFAADNSAGEPSDKQGNNENQQFHSRDTARDSARGGTNPPDTFLVEAPWHETDRAAPSELVRSALFGPNRRANRLIVGEPLPTNKGTELIVWGDSLTQFDLDLWMACVHLARFGQPILATVPQLLKVAGRSPGGTAEARVRESLSLLGCFQFRLAVRPGATDGIRDSKLGYTYAGNLIEHLTWKPGVGRWDFANVVLHPNLAKLFLPQRRTHIPARARSQLGDSPLAQWMYAFFRTHRAVFPLPVPYYHTLSGADSPLSDFRLRVKKAMTLLTEESLLYSVSLRRGCLFVQRNKPVVETFFTDAEWTVRSAAARKAQEKKGESL